MRTGLCMTAVLGLGLSASGQTFTNPLSTPALRTGDGPADPCVVEYLGTYYIYPTGDGMRYRVMQSDDLVHWTGGSTAFTMPAGSPWKDGWLWAPEIQRINGRFYLYYTAGDERGLHIGVADSSTPLGPFTDRSFDVPLISASSIDACCLVEGDDLYLYYVKAGEIWVRELRDPLSVDPAVEPVQCLVPDVPWEGAVNEGPYVSRRGSLYYMLYSGNGADTADYGVGVAWATSPLGPWTKQAAPYNPIFRRNDALGLWGPGHGSPVIGPDGVSDWHAYHHKTAPTVGWSRLLALDRLVPVARASGPGLAWTASGGTTSPTPAPRRAFAFSNFTSDVLPSLFHVESGLWTVQDRAVHAPGDGALRIRRPLLIENAQDFQFEWWVQSGGTPDSAAILEFSFETGTPDAPGRVGFHIRPGLHAVNVVAIDATGAVTVLGTASLEPALDWSACFRQVTLSKQGERWAFMIDRKLVLTANVDVVLGRGAWVRTTGMPVLLDGYRQTLVFSDDFESGGGLGSRWRQVSGTWSASPDAWGNRVLRQSDVSSGFKIAICDGPSLQQFDLQADFHRLAHVTGKGRYPKHGLIHSYAGLDNYAMVFIDDQYEVVATSAVINGEFQEWINAPASLQPTFTGGEFRNLAVTTDATTGDFVYSLDGRELLRRRYSGLPAGGQAGIVTELSSVECDNFRFSGSAAMTVPADFDSDGDVDQVDFGHLQACFTAQPWLMPVEPHCADADLDGQGGVGPADFAILHGCLSGSGLPADPGCVAP